MSKSKSKSAKARSPKHAPESPSQDGELAEDALDQVAGGGGVKPVEVSGVASADFQNVYQQQQQAFQALSKISKAGQDTAEAIIKNLKA